MDLRAKSPAVSSLPCKKAKGEYIMNISSIPNRARLVVFGFVAALTLTSSTRASGYNWTAGTITGIATSSPDGTIGVTLNPSTNPNAPPYYPSPAAGETGPLPCQAEGQPSPYANFYVIQPTNPTRQQFLAELMAAWLSGHIIYLYDQAGVCQSSGAWSNVHPPILDRIDVTNL